jgi:hypothetical protein
VIEVARGGDAAVVEAVAGVPHLPQRLVGGTGTQAGAQRGRGRKRRRRSC